MNEHYYSNSCMCMHFLLKAVIDVIIVSVICSHLNILFLSD